MAVVVKAAMMMFCLIIIINRDVFPPVIDAIGYNENELSFLSLRIQITHRDTLAIYHSTVNNMSIVFMPIYCYHSGGAVVAELKRRTNKIAEDNGRC